VRGSRGFAETRPPVNGERRPGGNEEVRYRSSYDDQRADTPQSGRLSQAELSAMIVREKWEDGEFDQEIAVDRKGLHRGSCEVRKN